MEYFNWNQLPAGFRKTCIGFAGGFILLYIGGFGSAVWPSFMHLVGVPLGTLLLATGALLMACTGFLMWDLSKSGLKAMWISYKEFRSFLREARLATPPLPQLVEPLTEEEMPPLERIRPNNY